MWRAVVLSRAVALKRSRPSQSVGADLAGPSLSRAANHNSSLAARPRVHRREFERQTLRQQASSGVLPVSMNGNNVVRLRV